LTVVVSGGAGFIGTNLVARLLADGVRVVAIDNFLRGARSNLVDVLGHPAFDLIEADLADPVACADAFDAAAANAGSIDAVWHLAANSDIAAGTSDPRIDLRDSFLTTFEILLQMRRLGIPRLLFASSSAIYGDHGDAELSEDVGPFFPVSNYGAMKLASEAQASAAAEAFLAQVIHFRFPNVIGVPATHGVLVDFITRLKAEPDVLRVLGDGTQRKPYLHVSELLDAMLIGDAKATAKVSAFNIGPVDDGATVKWIAEQVVARVSPGARIEYGAGNKGWLGDVSRFSYSTARIAGLGWSPRLGSHAALTRAIDEIARAEGFEGL